MTDTLSPAQRSRVMRAVKGRGTGPERRLEEALKASGVLGWVRHPRDLPGKPDLAFRGARVAVLVHGCFWHACPKHYRAPASSFRYPAGWWMAKARGVRARDRRVVAGLRARGWSVVVVWEHESPTHAASRVRGELAKTRRPT